jgi:type IV pilus modification protein PilV
MAKRKDNPKLINNDRGLTLIETLIALAIFSIGILGVAQLQIWNMNNNSSGNTTTQAMMFAQEKVEELKNVANPGTITAGSDEPAPKYGRVWNPTTLGPGSGCDGCTQVDVTVTYTGRGQNREISLTTILR